MSISLKRNNAEPVGPLWSLVRRFARAAAELSGGRNRTLLPPESPNRTETMVSDECRLSPEKAPIGPAALDEDELRDLTETPQIPMLTRPVWGAWRESGGQTGKTVLRVAGLCPASGVSGRVLLQESIVSDPGHHWGGEGAKSGILVLERLVVPPALGDPQRSGVNPQQVKRASYGWCYPWESDTPANDERPLLVTFRKEEWNTRPDSRQPVPMMASTPHYTHVTILPDGITIPIQG